MPTAPVTPTTATVYADFFFISTSPLSPAVSSGNPRFSLLSPSPQLSPTSGEGVDYGFFIYHDADTVTEGIRDVYVPTGVQGNSERVV